MCVTHHAIKLRFLALALPVLLLSSACANDVAGVCSLEIEFRTEVARASLRVSDTTTVRASALTCEGRQVVRTEWRYTAADGAIVRVDSITGFVTALAPGSTRIFARRLEMPFPQTDATITVTP